MKKKSVLQLALQFNFWVTMTTCNSLYFALWMLSNKLHELQELQLIVYTMQLIAIQLQFYGNNSVSTSMQLHNYNHDIMLPLLIFIHPLKFHMWHYDDFWINFFLKYWSPSFSMIVNDGSKLWHVAQSKNCHMAY
jgi:hypothetical protein